MRDEYLAENCSFQCGSEVLSFVDFVKKSDKGWIQEDIPLDRDYI